MQPIFHASTKRVAGAGYLTFSPTSPSGFGGLQAPSEYGDRAWGTRHSALDVQRSTGWSKRTTTDRAIRKRPPNFPSPRALPVVFPTRQATSCGSCSPWPEKAARLQTPLYRQHGRQSAGRTSTEQFPRPRLLRWPDYLYPMCRLPALWNSLH
jgi:hypothetical protein